VLITGLLLLAVAFLLPEQTKERLVRIEKSIESGKNGIYAGFINNLPKIKELENRETKLGGLKTLLKKQQPDDFSVAVFDNIPGDIKSINRSGTDYIVITETQEKLFGAIIVPVENRITIDENGTVEDIETPPWGTITIPEKSQPANETFVCVQWIKK